MPFNRTENWIPALGTSILMFKRSQGADLTGPQSEWPEPYATHTITPTVTVELKQNVREMMCGYPVRHVYPQPEGETLTINDYEGVRTTYQLSMFHGVVIEGKGMDDDSGGRVNGIQTQDAD